MIACVKGALHDTRHTWPKLILVVLSILCRRNGFLSCTEACRQSKTSLHNEGHQGNSLWPGIPKIRGVSSLGGAMWSRGGGLGGHALGRSGFQQALFEAGFCLRGWGCGWVGADVKLTLSSPEDLLRSVTCKGTQSELNRGCSQQFAEWRERETLHGPPPLLHIRSRNIEQHPVNLLLLCSAMLINHTTLIFLIV